MFVTFPCGVLGQVWYLIVLFPDLCRLSYFVHMRLYQNSMCWPYKYDKNYIRDVLVPSVCCNPFDIVLQNVNYIRPSSELLYSDR